MAEDDVLDHLEGWVAAGKEAALATVVATWGSSPRPVGSMMAIDEEGRYVGSVSGGCIESAVVKEAVAIMDGAPAKVLEFGVSNEEAWEVGLSCGGTVRIWVEAVG